MKKIYVIFLLSCLMVFGGGVMGQTITINLTSAGGSANLGTSNYNGGAERTWTQNTVTFGGKAITAASSPNAGAIQAQAANGLVYNTSPLPGRLLSVTITSWTGTTNVSSTLHVGIATDGRLVNTTAANYTIAATATSLGASTPGSWTGIGSDYRYFAIKRGTSAGYWDQIVITYESGTNYYWNGNNGTPLSGTWNNTDNNWTSPTATATPNVVWPSTGTTNIANFLTGGGTVTLPGTISSAPSNTNIGTNFIFSSTVAAALSSTIAISSGAVLSLSTASPGSITLSGITSGAGELNFTGSGTSILTASNTFTGNKTLTSGRLDIGNASALGTIAGTFNINGGTIDNSTGGPLTLLNYPQSWGGDFSFTGTNALNMGTGAVALSANRQVTVNSNTLTVGGAISGSFSLTKAGSGTLLLSGTNTYSGGTTITAGTLTLGSANSLLNAGSVTLNGGTLRTGSGGTGYSETMGALVLTANSTIELETNDHSISFTSSNASAWTAATTLTITGWTGTAGASGTTGKIFVGVGGLTATQLSQVSFTGFPGTPVILGTGELVPPNNSPSITVIPASLSGFTYVQGNGPSGSLAYDLSAANLSPASGNITITPPAAYEVSENNTSFSTSAITLPYSGAALATTSIYVRLRAGLSAGTYNSQVVTNAGGGASSQNVTLSGNVTASSTSDIIEDGDAAFYSPSTENIPYITWQSASITNTGSGANGSIGVFRFRMRDGGSALPGGDADALPTIFNTLTFNYTGLANTIRTAAIFNGNTKVADVSTVNANSLVFNTLSDAVFTVADNGTQVLTLRVTFNTTVTDNQKLVYSIGAATVASAATSSQLTTISASSDNGANDRNRIEVTADRIVYGTQPADGSINATLTAFTIRFSDVNNNLDFDNNRTVTLAASNGGVNMTAAASYTITATHTGIVTFSDVVFTSGPQTAITITANTSGLTNSNTVVSNPFNIYDVAIGTYYSNGNGNWNDAIWQRMTGSGWNYSPGAPASGTTDEIHIFNNVNFNTSGSFNLAKIIVENTGTFTQNNTTGLSIPNVVGNTLHVLGGGKFIQNSLLTFGGTNAKLEVEDNGFYYANYNSQDWVVNLWNGTEVFHPNSTFVVWTMNGTTDKLIPNSTAISTYNNSGYSAPFGNVIIDFANASAAGGYTGTLQLFYDGFVGNVTHGNLVFRTSNGNGIRWSLNSALGSLANPVTIGGNIEIENTFGQVVSLRNGDNNAYVYVKGNIINNGTNSFRMVTSTTGTAYNIVLTVDGNINVNSGNFYFNVSSSSGFTTTLNLKGDLTVGSSALFTNLSTTSLAPVNFTGTGDGLTPATTQTLSVASSGANRNQNILFNANANSYVQLSNQNFPLGASSRFTVKTGAVLDFGFNGSTALNLAGNGTTGTGFTAEAGSYLKITSPQGIMATSGAVGNIQTNTAPVFTQPITFHYIGQATQVTGTGIGTASNGRAVIVDLASNAISLTPSVSFALTSANNANVNANKGGILDIRQGQFTETASEYISGSSGTLSMAPGTLYRIAKGNASIGASSSDQIPRMSGSGSAGSNPYVLTGGTIELAGSGTADAFQTLRSADSVSRPKYVYVKYSGANTAGVDFKNLADKTAIDSGLIISANAIVDCRNQSGTASSFVGAGALVMDGGRIRFKNVSNAQPELLGTKLAYALTGGVTEFYGSSPSSRQTIKGKNTSGGYDIVYNEIEITGDITSAEESNVGQSSDNIHLHTTGGKLTVKAASAGVNKAGRLTISSASIRSANETPANTCSVIVEDGAEFITNSSKGFSGFTSTFSDNSSVHSEINTVSLLSGSKVTYDRIGAQDISNQVPYHHLTITGSGNKTAPAANLDINGDFSKSNVSVFLHQSGTVRFTGNTATAQVFSNTSGFPIVFNNVTDSSTGAGLTINGDSLFIVRELKFAPLSKMDLALGNITLKSSDTLTANVAAIPLTAAITYGSGNFIVERYLSFTRKWHLLSVPANSVQSIRDAWQDGGSPTAPVGSVTGYGVQITGPGGNPVTNGLDNTSATYSLKYQTGTSNAFTGVPNTLGAFSGIPSFHKGFMLFAYGDRRAGAGTVAGPATVLRTRGKLFVANALSGNEPAPVIEPLTVPGANISVGNPFASPLNFTALKAANLTISPNFQVWDPSNLGSVGAGVYQSILANGLATPGGGSIYNNSSADYRDIQSGQAFYVQAAATSVLVPFLENMKSNTYRLAARGGADEPQNSGPADLRMISSFLHLASSDRLVDGNRVILDDTASNDVNSGDVYKIMNDGANFGISKTGINLIVENRPMFQANDTVQYVMTNLSAQNYRMKLAVQHINAPQLFAELVDRFTHTRTPVSLTDSSFINFTVTADAASKAANRFYLVFNAAVGGPLPVNIVAVSAVRKPDKTVDVNWKVENEINITGYEVERSSNGIQFSTVGTQAPMYNNGGGTYNFNDDHAPLDMLYYRIKAASLGGAVQYSSIVKVEGEKAAAVFAVYPNPVSGKNISLQLNHIAAGAQYQLALYDAAGKLVHAQTVKPLPGNTVIRLDLRSELAAGTYQLQVQGVGEKVPVIPVIVQ